MIYLYVKEKYSPTRSKILSFINFGQIVELIGTLIYTLEIISCLSIRFALFTIHSLVAQFELTEWP